MTALVRCWACKGTGSLRLPDDCGYCRGEGEVLPEVNDDAHMDRDPSVRALLDPSCLAAASGSSPVLKGNK